jgi:hypothetical protein
MAPRPPRLLGLDEFLGSDHEGREKRDRGDGGNRVADERAYHRLAFSLHDRIILSHGGGWHRGDRRPDDSAWQAGSYGDRQMSPPAINHSRPCHSCKIVR